MIDGKKVAVITGASRGIGRETALRFARAGYHVALMGRDADALETLKTEVEARFGTEAMVCPGDVAQADYWDALVAQVVGRWHRIDALVNNAAWRTITPMDGISLAEWDKTIRICLTAPAFLAKAAAEVMARQDAGGAIVNVSSVMSSRTPGYSPAYIACKGAMESLTYELATLYGPRGIRVVCVNPGNVLTDMSSDFRQEDGADASSIIVDDMHQHTPLRRSAQPVELANVIHWLASDEASFITGTTVVADGGFSHNFNNYSLKKLQFPQAF